MPAPPTGCASWCCATSTSPAPIRSCAPGNRRRPRPTLIKVACEAALGKRAKIDVFGTDYPTPDGTCIRDYIHVSDLARAHSAALAYLRRGGASATFNCGYGHGASVLEVIEAVRRASRRDFPVEIAGRRPGDPPALVADVGRIRSTLDWQPQFEDLDTIVAHALAWERRLPGRREIGLSLTTRQMRARDFAFYPVFGLKIPLSAGKETPAPASIQPVP